MQIGIQLPEVERFVPWSEYRAMARTAEEAGYASIWLGDHFLYRQKDEDLGPWECWSMLAALPAATIQPSTLGAFSTFSHCSCRLWFTVS